MLNRLQKEGRYFNALTALPQSLQNLDVTKRPISSNPVKKPVIECNFRWKGSDYNTESAQYIAYIEHKMQQKHDFEKRSEELNAITTKMIELEKDLTNTSKDMFYCITPSQSEKLKADLNSKLENIQSFFYSYIQKKLEERNSLISDRIQKKQLNNQVFNAEHKFQIMKEVKLMQDKILDLVKLYNSTVYSSVLAPQKIYKVVDTLSFLQKNGIQTIVDDAHLSIDFTSVQKDMAIWFSEIRKLVKKQLFTEQKNSQNNQPELSESVFSQPAQNKEGSMAVTPQSYQTNCRMCLHNEEIGRLVSMLKINDVLFSLSQQCTNQYSLMNVIKAAEEINAFIIMKFQDDVTLRNTVVMCAMWTANILGTIKNLYIQVRQQLLPNEVA